MAVQRHRGRSSSVGSARRQRWCTRTATLAALTLTLAACAGIREQSVGSDGLAFFVRGAQLPSGGMDAVVSGALATGGGCVLLDEGGNRYPVVWPSGTSVEDTNPLVIELPSGEQLREGERVTGGGGYLEAGTLEIDVPKECLNEWGEVAVFNHDDEPFITPDEEPEDGQADRASYPGCCLAVSVRAGLQSDLLVAATKRVPTRTGRYR